MGTRASSEGTSKQPPAPPMSRESGIYTLLPPSTHFPGLGHGGRKDIGWGVKLSASHTNSKNGGRGARGGPCGSPRPCLVSKYGLSTCPRPWLRPLLRAGSRPRGAPRTNLFSGSLGSLHMLADSSLRSAHITNSCTHSSPAGTVAGSAITV